MSNVVKLAGKEIPLDPDMLRFDEHNINQFLQNFAANYKVYSEHHTDAQYVFSKYEDKYDAVYADKFRINKEDGCSDKMAEAKAKCDTTVQEALEQVRIAKRTVNMLYGFLKSMDRAHEDAQQFCYNLRREMDKLFTGIRSHE